MFVKTGIRAMAIILAGYCLSCGGAIAAQTQGSSANPGFSSSKSHSSAATKAEPAEIASSTPAAGVPVPETSTTADPTPAAPAPAPPSVNDKAPAEAPDHLSAKNDPSYIVGIADELQISVWKEPDLSGPVVVRPDGMITVPVVNDIKVVGMTTKQVQDMLTDKLKNVVAEPQVTVIVRNIRSRKVYLVGQVGRPGAVSLSGHETVLQVLAESGGPGLYAKSDKIYILRKSGEGQQKLAFNYKKALKGGDPKADFQLESGDVIVVP